MTGFVDPEFKHIKTAKPAFLMWRISNLAEENYRVKPVDYSTGNFYDEETYIIYNASPLKKPIGSSSKEPEGMEIYIHVWLGANTCEDEKRRAILKATDFDEVLGGVSILHREYQCMESNRFLSYFKEGMWIKRGVNTTEFMRRLYVLSKRASTWQLNELPTISRIHFQKTRLYVFEERTKFFIWIGKETGKADRFLASEVISEVIRRRTGKKIIFVEDGFELGMNDEDGKDFHQFFNLNLKKPYVLGDEITPNNVLRRREFKEQLQLYEVVIKKDLHSIQYLKHDPLMKSDLASRNVCLIDHMNVIWIWVSKRAPKEVRSRAINIAIGYLKEKPNLTLRQQYSMNVIRVVEGFEPIEFKLLFTDWKDPFAKAGEHYFAKKAPKPVNAAFTWDRLENFPHLATETQLLDLGGGTLKILQCCGSNPMDYELLEAKYHGIFNTNYSYLVHYTYGDGKTVVYHWLGSKEKENTYKLLKKLPGWDSKVQIRVHQFKETPHFQALFRGKMLQLAHGDHAEEENCKRVKLLRIIGGDELNTHSIEVEPNASSLNSENVFILNSQKKNYIWFGLESRGDERQMAKYVANKWTPDYMVVIEGREPLAFWSLLGGRLPRSVKEDNPIQEVMNLPPRAFKFLEYDNEFLAFEIVNCVQSDFRSSDIILLDSGDIVFVWIGSDVTEDENQKSEDLVHHFLSLDPRHRDLEIPMVRVHQGHEPPIFRGFFTSWDKNFWKSPQQASIPETPVREAEIRETIRISTLQEESPEILGIESEKKEEYPSDIDFYRVFGVARSVFKELPEWKRKELKLRSKLL